MQRISKLLVVSGLAIMAGPFSLTTQAQSYVDVEAERAAGNQQTTQPKSDPYSTPAQPVTNQPPASTNTAPAQSYPTTSYGLNNAPASTATISPQAQQGGYPPAAGGGSASNMLLQLQQLQQEVMLLNGKVEEQANELRRLKEQSLERYVDLDKRVSAMSSGAAVAAPAAGSASGNAGNATPSGSAAGNSQVAEQPGEGDAYRAAYALVRSQQFDQAVPAFKQFLQNYPAGRYAPNAHYWLGELYLVIQPADPESARQSFKLLIDQYPDNTKVPDALYKLGRVHFMKGNRERAREYFDRVISQYGSTDSSAAKLAQDFIDQNY
ncbi:MAG: tol-pal system protein YbgF [Halioglobus sp.]